MADITLTHQVPGKNESNKFEKIHSVICETPQQGAKAIALEIATLIRQKQKEAKNCVLGLATGSSPKSVYKELVRLHKEEGLSFKNVISFNLDEYFPMAPETEQSYVHFMKTQLFDHVDIKKENIHIPDGAVSMADVDAYCQQYDQQIADCGGLDLQILGIGRTGHIGFNEPPSSVHSATRLVLLDDLTRSDAAGDFYGKENVPIRAITMGIGTIMKAHRILLMAWGEGKADVIKQAIEEPVSSELPASYLQQHKNTTIIVDQAAGDELTRVKTPWMVGSCVWGDELTKKGVIWLSQQVKKPLLKLTEKDYADHSMSELLIHRGSAYQMNLKIFNELQRTITGWPGGKPNESDTHRPVKSTPAQKRVLIFSPHPDDDVISMGGTLLRLVDQHHEVHVAYQTSGNNAVFESDVLRFAEFFKDLAPEVDAHSDGVESVIKGLLTGKIEQKDGTKIKTIKGLIRKGEALSALRFAGVQEQNIHFQNLPFYEKEGRTLGDQDVKLTMELMQEIQPHLIYAAGDLSDPHGTHRICLTAIEKALKKLKNEAWLKACQVWLYRGAWQEWPVYDIEMAVPLSPDELLKKRKAIFKHQSQKDMAPFPGGDPREFWQRSEERNRSNADIYNALGLAEYEAIEAFKKMDMTFLKS